MCVAGVLGPAHPALGAQAGTVVPAQRLERQCEHYRIPQQRLEVDQVSHEHADLVVLVRERMVLVDVQLLEVHLHLRPLGVGEWFQAPHTLAGESGSCCPGDQHSLHDRLEAQVKLDRRPFGDTEDFDAQIRGRRDRR